MRARKNEMNKEFDVQEMTDAEKQKCERVTLDMHRQAKAALMNRKRKFLRDSERASG
jgi:hypothetical protein